MCVFLTFIRQFPLQPFTDAERYRITSFKRFILDRGRFPGLLGRSRVKLNIGRAGAVSGGTACINTGELAGGSRNMKKVSHSCGHLATGLTDE